MMRQYELVERVMKYDPDADEDLLNRAYVYAMKAHGNQKRASGEAYFNHPLEVAAILTEMKLDSATIAAAVSSTNWIPGWAYADQGLNATTYTGNCLNGYGCGVGLTWTAQGLQYVDEGFPLGVLCKAYLTPLPPSATPPPLPKSRPY